jgi:protoheme ferro-lyase
MTLSYDAVLLIAFGGPTAPEEIRPFLARVLRGIPIPPGGPPTHTSSPISTALPNSSPVLRSAALSGCVAA